jgi:hypothetical protein
MSEADSLKKTPAQSWKDLFHMNNSNQGLDGTQRTLYSGKGDASPVSMSLTKVSVSCGDGVITKPQIKNATWTYYTHTVPDSASYTISCLVGNFHKINLSGDLDNLVISDVSTAANTVTELTLLINAQNTYQITNWPTTTYWEDGTGPSFASQANNGSILIKLLSFDGGTNWYGQILAENLRPAV